MPRPCHMHAQIWLKKRRNEISLTISIVGAKFSRALEIYSKLEKIVEIFLTRKRRMEWTKGISNNDIINLNLHLINFFTLLLESNLKRVLF